MATLDGVTLPITMKYAPFFHEKRYVVTPTAGGAVSQRAYDNGIVQGDGTLEWTMELLCFSELCTLYTLYQQDGSLLFQGQYGEEYGVDFLSMKTTAQGGGNYSVQGTFIVRCVIRDICTAGYY